MTKQEFNGVKHLWKLIQAEASIRQVIYSTTHILVEKMDGKHPLYFPLLAAIFTLYARPFTASGKVGMVSENIIPPKSKAIHNQLMDLRHGLSAHTDTHKLKSDSFGPVLQAWFTFKGQGEPQLFTTSIELPREKLMLLHKYFVEMERLIHEALVVSLKLYNPQKPKKDGDYILNIYDEEGPVWITQQEALKLLPHDATSLKIVMPPTD